MRTTITIIITLLLVMESSCKIEWWFGKGAQEADRNNNPITLAITKRIDFYTDGGRPADNPSMPPGLGTEIEQLYKFGDTNGDGLLSIEELRDLASIHHVLTDEELRGLIAEADENLDGQLSFEEFANHMAKHGLSMKKAEINFKRDYPSLKDVDKDGKISMEVFERLYRFCTESFNRELIYKLTDAGEERSKLQPAPSAMTNSRTKRSVTTDGNVDKPTTGVLTRIKYCMSSFIDKVKEGPDYQQLFTASKKAKFSLLSYLKMPFMSSFSKFKMFKAVA